MNKKLICYVGIVLPFFVGIGVGIFFSFDVARPGEYQREVIENKQIENSLGIPLQYSLRNTTKLSLSKEVLPGILTQEDLGFTNLPEGQKVVVISPDIEASFLGGEYIYVEINDTEKLREVPQVHDEITSLDPSRHVEKTNIGDYLVEEQSWERYEVSPFGSDVQLCQKSVYIIDMLNSDNFPVIRLRYHQNMCEPTLANVWQELREGILNSDNED